MTRTRTAPALAAAAVWLAGATAHATDWDADAEPAGTPGDAAASSEDATPAEQETDPAVESGALSFALGEFLITPHLQYRIRYRHHEGHDFVSGGVSDTLRHRARLGLSAMWHDLLGAKIQLQDVRTFGEETDTLHDYQADGFDLHEAYAIVAPYRQSAFRLGRQEIAFENQRLVGAVDWSEQGRSFDALRFIYRSRGLGLDAFFAKVRDENVNTSQAIQSNLPVANRHFFGGNFHYDMMRAFGTGLVATIDTDQFDGRRQATVGALAAGEIAEVFRYEGEGYYQFGSAYGDVSYSSFLLAADMRVTFDVGSRPYVELYGAFLSGDDDPADLTAKTFETPYATNHKFYGEMDFFLNMVRDTEQRGLRDVGAALGASPLEGLALRAAYHWFAAMAERPDGLDDFGHELDLKAEYEFWTYGRLALLYGLFFPGDIMERGASDSGPEHFAYTTLDVKF